jgi:hypothetical protein
MKDDVIVERTATRLEPPSFVRRASWGAIFSGVFVTIVVQIMFTLLGAAIGFSTINPMEQQNPAQGLGLGSGIWLLVSALVSIWTGSCVAGRLCGGPRRADGMIHGIVTWSVATVAALLLLATAAGALLGGAGALLGNALGVSSNSRGAQGPMAGVKEIFPQAGTLLPPTGRTDGRETPGQLTALSQQDPELGAALGRMEANGGAAKATQDRDQVINLLTTKHNMDRQQAQNLVNQWDQQFQQIHAQFGQKARQMWQTAAQGISQGALWAFVALILGLGVAAWGGWAGTASLPRYAERTSALGSPTP